MKIRFLPLLASFIILFGISPASAESVSAERQAVSAVFVEHPAACGDGEAFAVIFASREAEAVRVEWRGNKFTVPLDIVAPGGRIGRCLLAVPLDSEEKSYALKILPAKGKASAIFQAENALEALESPLPELASAMEHQAEIAVERRAYPVQKLTVKPEYVAPPASELERIERESKEMGAVLRHISPNFLWEAGDGALKLERPLPGDLTSVYGSRRVFNNQPRSPHKGIDLDGIEGDPVKACASGTVALAAEHYYSGRVVVLDHGLGVKTIYMHLSEIKVNEGDTVQAGQLVGLVGSTGRVTGPHLHLGFNVMGSSVNPLPFMPDIVQEAKSSGVKNE